MKRPRAERPLVQGSALSPLPYPLQMGEKDHHSADQGGGEGKGMPFAFMYSAIRLGAS